MVVSRAALHNILCHSKFRMKFKFPGFKSLEYPNIDLICRRRSFVWREHSNLENKAAGGSGTGGSGLRSEQETMVEAVTRHVGWLSKKGDGKLGTTHMRYFVVRGVSLQYWA